MQDFINIIVNNGLGVASFIALIYFIKTSITKTNATLEEINKSLLVIQTNLLTVNERLNDLENEKGGK